MTQPQRKTLAPTFRNTGTDQWRTVSPHAPHMRTHWHGPIQPMVEPRERGADLWLMLIAGLMIFAMVAG